MKINNIVIFSFLSFLFSTDIVRINYFDNDLFSKGIYFDLESHDKTGYLFSKYHPYLMDDIEYMNFKIDGSMMYPIISSIPKKIFLNSTDTTTMSQLSVIQDHSNRYYDAGVALKTYLREGLSSTIQVDSKSIYGDNYNTKFITSFYKTNNNLDLDIGYMYNHDDVITYLESSSDDFNRGIESFSSKLYMNYKGVNNMIISNQFNSQISHYNRFVLGDDIDYLSEIYWNDFLINYTFGVSKLELQSNYKGISSDIEELQSDLLYYMNHDYHHVSLAYHLMHNPYLSFGINHYKSSYDKSRNYYFLNCIFDIKDFSIGLHVNNDIFLNMFDSTNENGAISGIRKLISTAHKFSLGYKKNNFMQKLIIGKNNTIGDLLPPPKDDYYYLYEAGINYKWIDLNFNYGKYDSDELYIKEYMHLSALFSPVLENKRYRPYCRVKFSNLGINSNYSISNEELDLFSDVNSSISGITIVDGEFGFLFNSFKIAFIKENMLDDYLYYSGNTYFYNASKYLINITWIFED